mgnify:CR=1 FL=1
MRDVNNVHIGCFLINPELTGEEIGKKAFQEFINLIFQNESVNSSTLNVFDYNVEIRKLYEKVGFKTVNVVETLMKNTR